MITHWRDVQITEQMLLAVVCPTCKRRRNEWCVYLPPTTADYSHSRDVLAKIARAGTPTRRCHNDRYAVARAVVYRRWARETQPVVTPPSANVMASLLAGREFEWREREQLRAWLSVHWRLLVHADVRTGEVAS